MIVCVCHRVSDRHIAAAVADGCASFGDLQAELRVGTGCGACRPCARTTFERCVEQHAAGHAPAPRSPHRLPIAVRHGEALSAAPA